MLHPIGERSMHRVVLGTVTYRQRIALVPGSIVEVRVEDATRANAPTLAPLLGLTRFEPAGQVPIPFEVELPGGGTDERTTYAVSARIYGPDGRLLFESDEARHVRADATTGRVELVLVPSGRRR
jgi:putative lipoprotein